MNRESIHELAPVYTVFCMTDDQAGLMMLSEAHFVGPANWIRALENG